jgi:hypothetical protein
MQRMAHMCTTSCILTKSTKPVQNLSSPGAHRPLALYTATVPLPRGARFGYHSAGGHFTNLKIHRLGLYGPLEP